MAPAVANETCDPFTPESEPCMLGNMVVYSVNASAPSDFSATIAFAKAKNIRLVIRNTGHDYSGKSTGAGALSIWTHHIKDIQYLNYSGAHYNGSAIKLGAGVQVWDAYKALHEQGLVVVAGDCATVGAAGGYSQGGGHSSLSSKFGLAADQALEWEVIDGRGQFLTASRTVNSDLYWALSGGGGGTYGVVYSLTVKAHKDFPITGVVLNFTADGADSDRFFDAVGYYHSLLPGYTAAGGVAIAEVTNTSFLLTPLTFPNMHVNETTKLMQPLLEYLDKVGIKYTNNITEFPNFLQHYDALIEPNPTQLVENGQYGGRFIPRSVIDNRNDDLTSAMRSITEDGVVFVSIGLNVSSAVVGNDVYNSVNPSWRESAMSVILTSPWPNGANLSDMAVSAKRMTEKWVPSLAAVAPDSGCYMSESDPREVDWKQSFYGANYQRLYSIKNKYDPDHVFYGNTSVGSDDCCAPSPTSPPLLSINMQMDGSCPKIDVHHHVYPHIMRQVLDNAGGDPSGWYTPPWSEHADRDFSKSVGNKTTIVSVTAPGACIEKDHAKAAKLARDCNEYCASLKQKDPATYGFFASLPSLFDTQGSITEIAYALDHLAADGITLFTRYGDVEAYLGHESFAPIWAELSKRKAVVFVHPTHPVNTRLIHPSLPQPMFDYPHETGRTAMSLLVSNTLQVFPGCKVILSHAGGTLPYLIHRAATMLPVTPMSVGKSTETLLEEAGEFYYDLALSSNPATLEALYEIAKPGHVLFGTDYPNAPTQAIHRFTAFLEDYKPGPEPLSAVLMESALGLFPRLRQHWRA